MSRLDTKDNDGSSPVIRVGYKPDLLKCRNCIFLRFYGGVRCLCDSPGDTIIREASQYLPDLKVPTKPYPHCQDEIVDKSN